MSFSNPWFKRLVTTLKDEAIPMDGSIVYCKLGPAEHTGIYIADHEIVEFTGNGAIQCVTPKQFLNSSIMRTGLYLYVACDTNGEALYDAQIRIRAKKQIDKRRHYNLILDNCHQFVSGCITGNFENADNFFWMLEDTIRKHFSISKLEWRVADRFWVLDDEEIINNG